MKENGADLRQQIRSKVEEAYYARIVACESDPKHSRSTLLSTQYRFDPQASPVFPSCDSFLWLYEPLFALNVSILFPPASEYFYWITISTSDISNSKLVLAVNTPGISRTRGVHTDNNLFTTDSRFTFVPSGAVRLLLIEAGACLQSDTIHLGGRQNKTKVASTLAN